MQSCHNDAKMKSGPNVPDLPTFDAVNINKD